MKNILFLILLFPVLASAQFSDTPRKLRLGHQTDANYLIYVKSGAPSHTPSDRNDAYFVLDTTNNIIFYYDVPGTEWDTLTAIGGATTRDSVYQIASVPDTTGFSPNQGDIFFNDSGDTLGVYGGSDGWAIFPISGSGGASVASPYVVYGTGSGITGEGNFTYDASGNQLRLRGDFNLGHDSDSSSIVIGNFAAPNMTFSQGLWNTIIGRNSVSYSGSVSQLTTLGAFTLGNTGAIDSSSVIGYGSGQNATLGGSRNALFGYKSSGFTSSATNEQLTDIVSIGHNSAYGRSGVGNVYVGSGVAQATSSTITGNHYNTILGHYAMRGATAGLYREVALGAYAGTPDTYTSGIYIGYNSQPDANNQIVIESRSLTGDTLLTTEFKTGNFVFDIDQTLGVSQDGYVLTWDNTAGQFKAKISDAGGSTGGIYGGDGNLGAVGLSDFVNVSIDSLQTLSFNISPVIGQTSPGVRSYTTSSADDVIIDLLKLASPYDSIVFRNYNRGTKLLYYTNTAQSEGYNFYIDAIPSTTAATGGIYLNDNVYVDSIGLLNLWSRTTTQRNSIPTSILNEGDLIYNSDSTKFQYYNGSGWSTFPASAGTPGAHASTHERAGSDEVDGDHLDIDWNPTYYTPATTPTEAANIDDLTAHLYGIDQALSAGAPGAHASTHITGGGDEVDGDKLDIDWTPSNYTPSITPTEADNLDNLTAHLYGIDQALGGFASSTHASTHITGGGDEVDGDKLDIDWTPANYTPATTPTEADNADNLTAHLYGIDQAIGSISDTHLFSENKTMTANRTHTVTGYSLDFVGTNAELLIQDNAVESSTAIYLQAGTTTYTVYGATGYHQFTAGAGATVTIGPNYIHGPNRTTANRPSPLAGMYGYNSTDNKFEYYNGSGWVQLEAPGAPGAHASTHITGQSDEIDGDKLDIDWSPSNYTPSVTPTEADNLDNLTAHLYGIDQALTGFATTSHASTHERAGSDEIDGDHLDIDWNPSNYTPATTPTEAANVDDLTAHLYGIDQALSGFASSTHASTHITGQSDEIDGDKLDIDWTPSNYTPSITPTEADNLDNLTAHLYGIDQVLASVGFTDIDTDYGNETVTSDWIFQGGASAGTFGTYDLSVGDAAGTGYGSIQLGASGIYLSSQSISSMNFDGSMLFRHEATLAVGNDPGIEFGFFESASTARLLIPESGAGNATAMLRSVTIAGPYAGTNGNAQVTGDFWTTNDSNLDFDTGTTGADLFVQDDIEAGGTLFVDVISEEIAASGVTVDGLLIQDGAISPNAFDGDQVDIDWNPSNYTPATTPTEADDIDDLTAHLYGIDQALGAAGVPSHASTHERAGADEIDGDHLDIDWNPSNYTPSVTPTEAANVDDLTAHLYGIDQALAGFASTSHASTHITGQSDEVDGDKLDIDWTPSNYTPSVTPTEADNLDNLTAHLYGIDQALTSVSTHASTHITGQSDEVDGDKLDIDWTPTNYTPGTTPTEADNADNLTAHLYGIDQRLEYLEPDAADSQTSGTIDLGSEKAYTRQIDLTGLSSITMTLNNPVDGGVYVIHFLNADNTDTVTWPATFKYEDGGAVSTDILSGGRRMIVCYYDGTNFYTYE